MILMILALLFGQQIDFKSECDSGKCVINGVPFGILPEAVAWQMNAIAPSDAPKVLDGGATLLYRGYKFHGRSESRFTQFAFNAKGSLMSVSTAMTPSDEPYEFPEVMNLYFALRDEIQNSGLYDSIEFMYSFKEPFLGTSEKDVLEGNFSNLEVAALKQDRNGNLSRYRFAKIWAIFQNKTRHSLKAVLTVAMEEGDERPRIILNYADTRYTGKAGYVYGIDTTYTRR